MPTILLLNKDITTYNMVHHAVTLMHDQPYALVEVTSIEEAMRATARTAPNLIIIDAALSISGLCNRLRGLPNVMHAPILFLMNMGTAQEIAQVLDEGADDCIRKPVVPRELGARIRTLMRRHVHIAAPTQFVLVLDSRAHRVQFGGRDIELTPTEYDLLETLARTPGKHVPTNDLLEQVWHYPPGEGDPALVRNHVRNLRRKLENDPDRPRIVTSYHGRGYTISATVVAQA